MKTNRHATLLQGSDTPRIHGSSANQAEWQRRKRDLRREAKLPCFPASENSFDAVAENRFTYGKAGKVRWAWKSGKQGDKVTSQSERLDKSQDSKWAARAYVAPQHAVVQPRDLCCQEQCSRVTWLHSASDNANDIEVITYGKVVIFRKTSQMRRFRDSRSPEHTLPLSFAKSELRRLLGVTDGDRAALLLGNPTTRDAASQASTAARITG